MDLASEAVTYGAPKKYVVVKNKEEMLRLLPKFWQIVKRMLGGEKVISISTLKKFIGLPLPLDPLDGDIPEEMKKVEVKRKRYFKFNKNGQAEECNSMPGWKKDYPAECSIRGNTTEVFVFYGTIKGPFYIEEAYRHYKTKKYAGIEIEKFFLKKTLL